jgi:hypothetical protein
MPHFSAPHVMAAPHISAPVSRFAAPRTFTPNLGVRTYSHTFSATPHAYPHITRFGTHVPHAISGGLPGISAPSGLVRHAPVAPIGARTLVRHPGVTTGTVGVGPAAGAGTIATQLHRTPILRNTALTNLSPKGVNRALTRSTFRGRFAQSGFVQDWKRHHHRHFGVVIGFVGPIFWPYAYDDFIDYTYWPYAYDTFWPYAFDDVYEGIYGAYAPEYAAPPATYAYAGAPASGARYAYARRPSHAAGAGQVCSAQAQGLTDFPIDAIAQQVAPTEDQQRLLDDLRTATASAVGALQAACPTELANTPTGRLAAMRTRVEAMVKAVTLVLPALDTFYQALSDEQKQRFNLLDQSRGTEQQETAQFCSASHKATQFPTDQIARSLSLSGAQDAALKELGDASAKAADALMANCPAGETLTPTARIAAMEARLNAVLQALDGVQPALANFFGLLSDEQKARFNRLARPAT